MRHDQDDAGSSDIMNDSSESDLCSLWSRLARDLGFRTEQDSAAALSALFDHHKREEGNSLCKKSVLVDDNVSCTDVVCVVALNTATEWLSQSEERADALLQYKSFMDRLDEWTVDYVGERQIPPYVASLQVLLRMCMNSERPANVRPSPSHKSLV
jgi:hypothetical protein